jgi:heat shock protein HtpX
MSALRTAVLLGALSGLLVGLGYIVGGAGFALVALVLAGVINFVSYFFSDKLALRMAGAKEVTREQDPKLHAMVEEVAILAGVPKPKVYVVQNESPNAFATGRNPEHAVVAVTTGIQRILTDRELRAVIGHEIGHVKNRDILIGTVAATIAGAISYIQTMLIWGSLFGGNNRNGGFVAIIAAVVAALAAGMLQMAVSRTREYAADKSGAEYVHDPESLASALAKLHNGVQMQPMQQSAGAEATSSLYIVHPFRMEGGIGSLFSTHPPVEERIKRLRRMAGYVE